MARHNLYCLTNCRIFSNMIAHRYTRSCLQKGKSRDAAIRLLYMDNPISHEYNICRYTEFTEGHIHAITLSKYSESVIKKQKAISVIVIVHMY